jgi:hypothetical protein
LPLAGIACYQIIARECVKTHFRIAPRLLHPEVILNSTVGEQEPDVQSLGRSVESREQQEIRRRITEHGPGLQAEVRAWARPIPNASGTVAVMVNGTVTIESNSTL